MHDFLLSLLMFILPLSLSLCGYFYVHFYLTKFVIINTLYPPVGAFSCISSLLGRQFLNDALVTNISFTIPLFPLSNRSLKERDASSSTLTFPHPL